MFGSSVRSGLVCLQEKQKSSVNAIKVDLKSVFIVVWYMISFFIILLKNEGLIMHYGSI